MRAIANAEAGSQSLAASNLEDMDRVSTEFEAALRAGDQPRIEDHLAGVEDPVRSAVLCELVAVEVGWRKHNGECPQPDEYHARFRAHSNAVSAAFDRASEATIDDEDVASQTAASSALAPRIRCWSRACSARGGRSRQEAVDRHDALLAKPGARAASPASSAGASRITARMP
jgi:hypothetical protein